MKPSTNQHPQNPTVGVHILHATRRVTRRVEGGVPIRGGRAVGDVLAPGGPAVRGGYLAVEGAK